jgi:hypothetical protein
LNKNLQLLATGLLLSHLGVVIWDYLVVEGTSHGKMSGKSWAGGTTPGGRFWNLFKFRDGRISSVHVYLDPDYTGEDEARFRWGKKNQLPSPNWFISHPPG